MMQTKAEKWKTHVRQSIKGKSAAFPRWSAETLVLQHSLRRGLVFYVYFDVMG
jgi:hypothetical protein